MAPLYSYSMGIAQRFPHLFYFTPSLHTSCCNPKRLTLRSCDHSKKLLNIITTHMIRLWMGILSYIISLHMIILLISLPNLYYHTNTCISLILSESCMFDGVCCDKAYAFHFISFIHKKKKKLNIYSSRSNECTMAHILCQHQTHHDILSITR